MKAPVFDPAWSDEVKALYRHDMEQTWDPSIAPHMFNQYRFLIDTYLSVAGSGGGLRILDVGCAQATLAMMLAEAGHHVVALDIRQPFLEYAATRYERGDIRFVQGDVIDAGLEGSFDIVFVNQVIEHVVRPVELMTKVHGWLARDGRAVVTTPNGEYFKNSLPAFGELGDVEKYAHLENSADGDGHFFAYTPSELEKVLCDAGFVDVRGRCFETPWISGHVKFRYLHRALPYAILKLGDHLFERIPLFGNRLCHQLLVTGRRGE